VSRGKKMLDWWMKNFASCDLGDKRLNDRAFLIGKALSQGFGKALTERSSELQKYLKVLVS